MKKFLKVLGYLLAGIGILAFVIFGFISVGIAMLSMLFGNVIGFVMIGIFDILLLMDFVCEVILLVDSAQEKKDKE